MFLEEFFMNFNDIESRFPYLGVSTFFGYPHTKNLNGTDVAMVGVPFDHGTTNRPGARFGPRGIRTASQNYGIYLNENKGAFDSELQTYILGGVNVVDYGDVPILPTHTKTNMRMIHSTFKEIVENCVFPVAFGGDHTITYPIVKAFKKPMDIIHFDTHLDFVDGTENLKFSHSNPLKRVSEMENINNITQIGIRGFTDKQENYDESTNYGSKIITASEVIKNGTSWVLKQIPESDNIYVTIDIDVLDPSIAPGTGTPEPGGLNYLQLKEMLTNLYKKGKIQGFDMVEVNPLFDLSELTSLCASRLAFDFLGSIF
jgi:agmatinase